MAHSSTQTSWRTHTFHSIVDTLGDIEAAMTPYSDDDLAADVQGTWGNDNNDDLEYVDLGDLVTLADSRL